MHLRHHSPRPRAKLYEIPTVGGYPMSEAALWKQIRNRIVFAVLCAASGGCLIGAVHSVATLLKH